MDDMEQLKANERVAQASMEAAESEMTYQDNEIKELRAALHSRTHRKDFDHLLTEEIEEKIAKAERTKQLAGQRQAQATRDLLACRRDLRQLLAERALKEAKEKERNKEKVLERARPGKEYTPT